jgi:hypothetical protein
VWAEGVSQWGVVGMVGSGGGGEEEEGRGFGSGNVRRAWDVFVGESNAWRSVACGKGART